MKDELQGKMVEILTSIQAATGKVSDFAVEQMPDIAQQWVAYGRALTALTMALSIAALIGGLVVIWMGRRAVSASRKAWEEKKDGAPESKYHIYNGDPHWFTGGGLAFFGAFTAFMGMKPLMLVWMAPKVWLLEKIANVLK